MLVRRCSTLRSRWPCVLRQHRLPTAVALHIHPRIAEIPADVPLSSMSLVDGQGIDNHNVAVAVYTHDNILVLHALVLECACSDVSHHLRLGAHLTHVVDRKVVISMDPIKSHRITGNPGVAPLLFHLLYLALRLIVL